VARERNKQEVVDILTSTPRQSLICFLSCSSFSVCLVAVVKWTFLVCVVVVVDFTNKDTQLFEACKAGNNATVVKLLDQGANPNAKDSVRVIFFVGFFVWLFPDITNNAGLGCANSAEHNGTDGFVTFVHRQDGRTPVYFAAWYDHAEVITTLAKRGANLDTKKKVRVFVCWFLCVYSCGTVSCLSACCCHVIDAAGMHACAERRHSYVECSILR
jgi:ankyrin repeat protein